MIRQSGPRVAFHGQTYWQARQPGEPPAHVEGEALDQAAAVRSGVRSTWAMQRRLPGRLDTSPRLQKRSGTRTSPSLTSRLQLVRNWPVLPWKSRLTGSGDVS